MQHAQEEAMILAYYSFEQSSYVRFTTQLSTFSVNTTGLGYQIPLPQFI
jgi:hypothetical protein